MRARTLERRRPSNTRRVWLPAALGAVIFSAPLLAATTGPPEKKHFYLKAQPFSNALAAWYLQSGVEYLCYLDPMAPLETSAVIGEFTPADALTKMLDGTGLRFDFTEDGKAAIRYSDGIPSVIPDLVAPVIVPPRPPMLLAEDLDISTEVYEMVVTGTKIHGGRPIGSDVVTLNPRIHGTQPTVVPLLEARPEFSRGGVNGDSADGRLSLSPRGSGNIVFASATHNLRALGSAGTLMLVNDRRTALSGQGVGDVSAIPAAFVDRVDIVKDGASAVYGTDVVGGVVNILLKQVPDYNETRVGYATTTASGRQQMSASQIFGAEGDLGSIVGGMSYLNQTALSSDERPWTADVPTPENIYPSNKQISAYLAGRYALAEEWTLGGQLLHSRIDRFASGFWPAGHLEFPVSMDRTHGVLSAQYASEDRWSVAITGLYSREETDFSFRAFPSGSSTWDVENSQAQHLTQSLWALSVEASRSINLFGMQAPLSIGVEHREEGYARQLHSPTRAGEAVARVVKSGYVEVQLPFVGETNRFAGMEALSMSIASRLDRYNDIGPINNLKVGIAWTPLKGLDTRATLGWSLKAPTVGEEMSAAARGTDSRVGIHDYSSADGQGTEAVALLLGSNPLRPQTARHWTAGFTLRPERLKGWAFDMTYFNVNYSDIIIMPPVNSEVLRNPDVATLVRRWPTPADLQAAIASDVGGPVEYVDRRGDREGTDESAGRPEQDCVISYDARLTNASVLRSDGFDMGVGYSAGSSESGQIQLGVNATLTRSIETVLTPGAKAVDFVGTTGYPPRWKGLATAAFIREEGLSAIVSLQVTDSYTDTSSVVPHRVRSSMTTDVQLSYTFSALHTPALAGVTASLSVANVFNEAAPYITGSLVNRNSHYDTANFEPQGRLVSLELRKRW